MPNLEISNMSDREDSLCATLEPEFKKVLAGPLPGAEGPVFTTKGAFYMVAPEVEAEGKPAGQILSIDLEANTPQANIICSPSIDGDGGIPAGCQADQQGQLWVADMRLGILKVDPNSGEYVQVAREDSEGHVMQGCNDCSFDYHGNLWVTAPAGEIAPHPYRRSMEEPFGSVYCLPVGSSCPIKVASDIQFPNGLAVQHDVTGTPRTLIVAETPTKKLWGFTIEGAGKIRDRKLWGELPGDHEGGPDGMDFDAEGNLLVANWGAGHIEVFGPEGGTPRRRIRCPFLCPSNLHFQPASKQVLVTEHENHTLWRMEWQTEGRIEYCQLAGV